MGIGPRPPTSQSGMRVLGHVVDQGIFGEPRLGTLNCFGSFSGGGKTADVTPPPVTPPETALHGTVLVTIRSFTSEPPAKAGKRSKKRSLGGGGPEPPPGPCCT